MSTTELEERWEAAFQAAERAVSTAISIGALSAAEAADWRNKLSAQREGRRVAAGGGA